MKDLSIIRFCVHKKDKDLLLTTAWAQHRKEIVKMYISPQQTDYFEKDLHASFML